MVLGNFPFGQPVRKVVQRDRTPKRVFILGVYASAVHARWLDARGKQLVQAIGVDSEPCIFWDGCCPEGIISRIKLPAGAGCLEPAAKQFNGPSGRSLNEHYLEPLKLTRKDVWLCDLVPYSRMNPGQRKAISRSYKTHEEEWSLTPITWLKANRSYKDEKRFEEIKEELRKSSAAMLITLGDQPLKWFAQKFGAKNALRAYGKNIECYGRMSSIIVDDRHLNLLPLVHPRQAAGLAFHDPEWKSIHKEWKSHVAPNLQSFFKHEVR